MIYISGRITGNKNWKEQFNAAEKYLRSCTNDNIINPLDLSAIVEELFSTPKWRDYMKVCVRELLQCDTIYMLRGWWKSKGARLERKIAKALGIEIIYQRKNECEK